MKNFSLSLYAFHLRDSFTHLPGEVVADADLLWENLVKLGENNLTFPSLKDLRSKLVSYHHGVYTPQQETAIKTEWLSISGKDLDLGSLPTPAGFNINANLQPFLLNDTYAIDLTLSPELPNTEIDIPQLQHFQPQYLLPANIQASLGQTLSIYGEVEPSEDCETLAQKIAIALVAGINLNSPILIRKGELFESLLFEYQALDTYALDDPAKQCQILIVINNSQAATEQLATVAHDWLLKLLWSYHKILYIYQLARQRYGEGRQIYGYLENKIQEFNNLITANQPNLSALKSLISQVPQTSLDYTRCCQDLETHHTAITTNITNYKTCLDNITAINNGNIPQTWEDFFNKECQKWQKQIQTDIHYLAPGKEIFGQLVDTIRGIVETEQAESDRRKETADKIRDTKLQNTIQAVGVGIGVGTGVAGIFSQTFPLIIEKKWALPSKEHPFLYPHPFLTSFGVSLILGAFLGWQAWRYFKQRLDSKLPPEASSTNTLAVANSKPEELT
ncbi:hypothetical protein NIES37_41470 [Tolypothrix tenuis PCC 7101]|uniref:Uncharacterized protein n=1 Tax=Tolypothrix tenuis PCC 7101 TaxID=231146 RepID=A0A1Z4N327_9CYAN|nr:hypothetical protein [Aulosira sp. FACHB-113]BAZ00163.1 hypothetical protein NIES37_41470 [Tolypothrix tenuis PCC 7101]BAZ75916.1 hypothetical protein NIES50_45120 [Aulosira laxa NIES-50]